MIPFSLLWGGFAIFWEWSVLTADAGNTFFALWGLPFVLIGLYLIFGRFIVDAQRRARTFYGITNQRIIIKEDLFSKSVKSLDLATLPSLQLSERSDRSGTISFGAVNGPIPEWMADGSWPGMGKYTPPRFYMIEQVRSVYESIRELQQASRVVGV